MFLFFFQRRRTVESPNNCNIAVLEGASVHSFVQSKFSKLNAVTFYWCFGVRDLKVEFEGTLFGSVNNVLVLYNTLYSLCLFQIMYMVIILS